MRGRYKIPDSIQRNDFSGFRLFGVENTLAVDSIDAECKYYRCDETKHIGGLSTTIRIVSGQKLLLLISLDPPRPGCLIVGHGTDDKCRYFIGSDREFLFDAFVSGLVHLMLGN